jgi:VIT1/CCC1 family predicted Fe2+/Mn2+ transporter
VNRRELVGLIRESGWVPGDHGMTKIVDPWITQMRSAFEKASEYIAGHPSCTPGAVREAVMEGVSRISAALVDDVVDELNSRGSLGADAHRILAYTVVARRAAQTEAATAERQTRDRRLDEARGRADQYQAAIRAAEARLANLQAARSQAARPEGVGRIISALGYITGVCVVVPLALMSWGRTSLPAWSRSLIVALFISGLAVFLWVIVDLLRDHPEEEKQPAPTAEASELPGTSGADIAADHPTG